MLANLSISLSSQQPSSKSICIPELLVCINGRKEVRLVSYEGGVGARVGAREGAGGCDGGDQIVNDNTDCSLAARANASSLIILLNRFVIPLPLPSPVGR